MIRSAESLPRLSYLKTQQARYARRHSNLEMNVALNICQLQEELGYQTYGLVGYNHFPSRTRRLWEPALCIVPNRCSEFIWQRFFFIYDLTMLHVYLEGHRRYCNPHQP